MTEEVMSSTEQVQHSFALGLGAPLNPRVVTPNCLLVQDSGVGGVISYLGNNVTTNDLLTLLLGIEGTILNNTGNTATSTNATNAQLVAVNNNITTTNTLLNAILGQLVTNNNTVLAGNAILSTIATNTAATTTAVSGFSSAFQNNYDGTGSVMGQYIYGTYNFASNLSSIAASSSAMAGDWTHYFTLVPNPGSTLWR
jgi:hypothetical protein